MGDDLELRLQRVLAELSEILEAMAQDAPNEPMRLRIIATQSRIATLLQRYTTRH